MAKPLAKKRLATPSKAPGAKRKAAPPKSSGAPAPRLFRLNIEVADLDRAEAFYGALLAQPGRRLPGSRVYFDCGATLQVVEVAMPHIAAKALYFATSDLDAAFRAAAKLKCLSDELVHGEPGGAIVCRPWGERSFYAEDPWGNPLCFVDASTIYSG